MTLNVSLSHLYVFNVECLTDAVPVTPETH